MSPTSHAKPRTDLESSGLDIRGTSQRRRMIQLSIVLIAGMLYTSAPTAIALFRNGRTSGIEGSTGSVEVTGGVAALSLPLLYIFILVCALILIFNLRSVLRHDVRFLLLVCAGLAVFFLLRYFAAGQVLSTIVVLAVFSASIWSIRLRLVDLKILGFFGFVVALISLTMAVFTPLAWQHDIDKSLLDSSVVLAGPFSQMNVLGMTLVALFPFIGLFNSRLLTMFAGLTMITAIILSSSRSSEIAISIGVLGAVLLYRSSGISVRKTILAIALIGIFATVISLPFSTTDPRAFTNRGIIWMGAARYFEDSWLIGHYDVFGFQGKLNNDIDTLVSHGHNLAIHYLAMSGLVGFCAILIIFIPMLTNSWKMLTKSVVPATAMITLVSLGLSELPHRTDSFDGAAWATWGALFCLSFVDFGSDITHQKPPKNEISTTVSNRRSNNA